MQDQDRNKLRSRFRGSLLGLAAGDALGTTLEFKRPDPSNPLVDMVGGGAFGLLPGQWTDDTSMALCLAESLIEKRGFDPRDQLARYVRWYREGHLSSNGQCFDIGITTRTSLYKFEQTNEPYPASTSEKARSGNGSLMRLCPAPLFFYGNWRLALDRCADSSRTTHGSRMCQDACRYFGGLLLGAISGATKDQLLSDDVYCPVPGYFQEHPLCPEVLAVAQGSYKRKEPPEIVGSGFAVASLEAVLWAFFHSDSFQEGVLKVANLGDDADTTAAILGQLAGAFYGVEAIPLSWRRKIALRPLIMAFADELLDLAVSLGPSYTQGSDDEAAPPASEQPPLSVRYRTLQDLFAKLEAGWAPIQRKLLPGPHMYTSLASFEADRALFLEPFPRPPKKDTSGSGGRGGGGGRGGAGGRGGGASPQF